MRKAERKGDTLAEDVSLSHWRVIGGYQVNPNWSRAGTAGTVHAALGRLLRNPVAVKILKDPSSERELLGVRLVHGVTVHNPHRHLIPILHADLDSAAGHPYYVMPLADDLHTGEVVSWIPDEYRPKTLEAHLRLRGRPLPLAKILYVAEQTLRGARYLHGESLIHCDIKPSNLFFIGGQRGRWLLGDFGSTTLSGPSGGWFWGTPWYMPPERKVSPKADVYALGKTIFRMASPWGPPRKGDELDPFEVFRTGNLLLPLEDTAFRDELRNLVLRACSRDLRDRFTPEELWDAVRTLQQQAHMTRKMEMTLDGDFDRVEAVLPLDLDGLTPEHLSQLDEEEARQLVRLLMKVRTLVTPLDTEIERGSVLVRMELTRAEAEHLEEAIDSGHFNEFPILRVRTLLTDRSVPTVANPAPREPFNLTLSDLVHMTPPPDPGRPTWWARLGRVCADWRIWLATGIVTAGLLTARFTGESGCPLGNAPPGKGKPLAVRKVPDLTAEPGTRILVPLAIRRIAYSGPVRLLLCAEDGVDVRAEPVTIPAGRDHARAVLRVGPRVPPDTHRVRIYPFVGKKGLKARDFSLIVPPHHSVLPHPREEDLPPPQQDVAGCGSHIP